MRRGVAAKVEHRERRLGRDDGDLDRTDDHAGFRLETVEFGADAFDIGRAIGLWDEQAVEPGLHHRGEVVEGQAGIERVDADEEGTVTRGPGVEKGGDLRTRGPFPAPRSGEPPEREE